MCNYSNWQIFRFEHKKVTCHFASYYSILVVYCNLLYLVSLLVSFGCSNIRPECDIYLMQCSCAPLQKISRLK
jgi:hypothetical protein